MTTDIIIISTPPEISCSYVSAVTIAGNQGGSLTIINSTAFQFTNIYLYNPFPIQIIISNLTLPAYAASITSPYVMLVTRNANNYLVCQMNSPFPITLSAGPMTGVLTPTNNQAGTSADYIFSMNF